MWILVTVIVNIILKLNVVHSQNVNENTGPIDLHAKIGTVPIKYQVLDANDLKAGHKVATMAEMMRLAFPTGFGLMPSLDPYKKKEFEAIPFHFPHLWLSGKVYLKDLTVTGAQKFTLKNLQLRLKNSRTDAIVSIPQLVIEVDFEVRATLGILPIVFGAHLRIVVTGVSISGVVGASRMKTSDNRQVFQLSSADVNAHAQNIQIEVANFHIEDGMQELDKAFPTNKWIDELKDDIAVAAVRTTMDEVNSVLKNYTVDQVMVFLLS